MDDNSKQLQGITSTVSTIGFQNVCDIRDLPHTRGTMVTGLGKEFTQLPAVCLLIDILGFGRLMEKHEPINMAF